MKKHNYEKFLARLSDAEKLDFWEMVYGNETEDELKNIVQAIEENNEDAKLIYKLCKIALKAQE